MAVLFTCVLIVLSSAAVFAASEDPGSPDSSEVSFLAPDLDSAEAYKVTQDILPLLSEGTRAEYTVSDIYTLLYDCLRAQRSDNAWGIPTLVKCMVGSNISNVPTSASSSVLGRLATLSSNIGGMYSNLKEIHEILNGQQSGVYVRPSMQECLFHTYGSDLDMIGVGESNLWIYDTALDIYSAVNQVHADGQNMTYHLSNISQAVSNLTSFSWTNTSVIPRWYLNSDNQVINSSQTGSKFSVVFQNFYSTSSDIPLLYRVYVPIMSSDLYHVVSDFDLSVGYFNPANNSLTAVDSSVDYYLEPTTRGTYIYLFGFRPQNVTYVTFTLSGNVQYDSSYTGSVAVMSFDTDSYQQIKQAFNSHSTNHYLEYLANNLVDPSMQQAKEESQPVIDDTLDGFTGNGSAAPSTGDTGSMKGISGSVRSGLDTGASAGDAVSVFSNSSFWGWFSQDNSDKINSTYPAPDVNSLFNTRALGDYVPDFISGDQDYLSDHLGSNPW